MHRIVVSKVKDNSEILIPLDRYVERKFEAKFWAQCERYNVLGPVYGPMYVEELEEYVFIVCAGYEDKGFPWEGIKFIYGIKEPGDKMPEDLTEEEKREILGDEYMNGGKDDRGNIRKDGRNAD